MKEKKKLSLAEYKPRDLGLISQRNFGINLARGERGILSYGIHFNGKDFIDPHSSLTLGRLYGARFSNRRYGGPSSEDGAWYTLLWCDKSQHKKNELTPWAPESFYGSPRGGWVDRAAEQIHSNLVESVHHALELGLQFEKDASKALSSHAANHVERLDATEMRDCEHYPKSQRCNDIEGYSLALSHIREIRSIELAFEKSTRAIKYTLNELSVVRNTTRDLFYRCMTMQVAMPQVKPPGKLMSKVISKLLVDGDGGCSKQARSVLEMCDIMSDLDKIKAHSTKVI